MSIATEPDRLVKLDYAAHVLGVCRRTLDARVRAGELETVKVGTRAVRVRLSDVERLVETGFRVERP